MKDDSGEILAKIGVGVIGAIIFPIIWIPCLLLQGWVGMKLWGWFAVPFGLPQIGLFWFCGICSLVAFIFPMYKTEDKMSNIFIRGLIGPFTALFLGWLVHLAMLHWG